MVIIDFLTLNVCKNTLILGNAFYGTPGMNIAIRKKLDRDLGLKSCDERSHKRKNLKEIILFECLIEESDWLRNPRELRANVVNIDGKEELSDKVTTFWKICGQNRDLGTQQLSRHEVVNFEDVTVLKKDSDETIKSVKTLIKELPDLIKTISEDNSLKCYIEDHFKTEIRTNKKLSVVSNFFEHVKQIVENQERNGADEVPDVDLNDEEGLEISDTEMANG